VKGFTYFLDCSLGEGMFGKVYKGTEDTTKREAAIKVIPKVDLLNDEE